MSVPIAYLDNSAMVKRYIKEPGSDLVIDLYTRSYSGECVLSYSLWNIGEILTVLDKAGNIGRLDPKGFSDARRRFIGETRRMIKLRTAIAVPVRNKLLIESWKLVEKYHIHVADALQIATAKHVNASSFLTGDKRLHKVATEEHLSSTCPP